MSDARIIGTAIDVFGVVWEVRERRATKHGWLLEIGWPKGEPRGRGGRGVATILTQPLAEYITRTRRRDVDLPIGLNAITRLRSVLGVRWDWQAWWDEREEDLLSMTVESFAAKHGCSTGAVSQRRREVGAPLHKKMGRPPALDQPADANLNIRVPKSHKAAWAEVAKSSGLSLSHWVIITLNEAAKRPPKSGE